MYGKEVIAVPFLPFCFSFVPGGTNFEPLFTAISGPGELEITQSQRSVLRVGLSDQCPGI